mmetsp:Transcript_88376/g.170178  ORF Transcript_88376/g.170178 Transcript_88376/m.170178 type:complete len:203 (+) Transcript_88376:189-797(+)
MFTHRLCAEPLSNQSILHAAGVWQLLLGCRQGSLHEGSITANCNVQSFVSLPNHVYKVLPVAQLLQSHSEWHPQAFPATILKPTVEQTNAVAEKIPCLHRFPMLLARGGMPTKVGRNMAHYPGLLQCLPDGTFFTRCILAGFEFTSRDGVLLANDLFSAIVVGLTAAADQQKLKGRVRIQCCAGAQGSPETQNASAPLVRRQ